MDEKQLYVGTCDAGHVVAVYVRADPRPMGRNDHLMALCSVCSTIEWRNLLSGGAIEPTATMGVTRVSVLR